MMEKRKEKDSLLKHCKNEPFKIISNVMCDMGHFLLSKIRYPSKKPDTQKIDTGCVKISYKSVT